MSVTSSPASLQTTALSVYVATSQNFPNLAMAAPVPRASLNRSGIATNLDSPGVEYFWSVELKEGNRSYEWKASDEGLEDDDEDYMDHTLLLKMAVLGDEAVPKDVNLVTLESKRADGKPQKGAIVNLCRGEGSSMCTLKLSLNGKVGGVFKLERGAGPVHISGNYLQEFPIEEPLDATQTETDESCEEEVEEGEGTEEEEAEEQKEVTAVAKGKKPVAKRKAPASKANKQKKSKMEVDEDDDDEEEDDEEEEEEEADEEDEDEDDEDYEEEKPVSKKSKKAAPAKDAKKGKAAKSTPEVAKKVAKKVKK